MGEDVDECCLELRVDVLPDVLEQDLQGKEHLYLLGADIVAIVGHVGEVIDLSGKGLALSREHLRKLLHLVPLAVVVYVKLPVQRLNRQNQGVRLLKSQLKGL